MKERTVASDIARETVLAKIKSTPPIQPIDAAFSMTITKAEAIGVEKSSRLGRIR
jgi:hypothetical protein